MKKWLKWLLVAIGIAFIGLIIYFAVKQALREEAVLTFPDTIVTHNSTDKDVDKIVKALSYNVLGYDTIDILISYIPKHMEQIGDIDLKAYVNKNSFTDNAYVLHISKKLTPSEYKKVLSHEFAHIKQFQEGDLKQIGLRVDGVIYKGDTILYKDVPYKRRPHEIDAHAYDGKIYNQLDDVLYK